MPNDKNIIADRGFILQATSKSTYFSEHNNVQYLMHSTSALIIIQFLACAYTLTEHNS